MAFTGFELPNINGSDLSDEKERRKILEYLYQLTEQLRYVLSNIDEDNLSQNLVEQIGNNSNVATLENTLTDVERGVTSLRKQTADGFEQTVKRDELISSINQSPELIAIASNRITLEGYVTINGSFTVDEDGYLRCTGGTLGAFSVDSSGGLMGNGTFKVGGLTLSGRTISGMTSAPDLLIDGDHLSYDDYSGSGAVYFLGMDSSGSIKLFDIVIYDDGLGDVSPDLSFFATSPGGGTPTPSTPSTVNVIQITTDGSGLTKRASASTSASSLGTCSTNEVYAYTSTPVDSDGYTWACCNRRYTYNSSTGKWSGSSVSTFYVRQTNNAGSKYYFNFTTVTV